MKPSAVTSLPDLNQNDFPALPEIPEGKALLCFGTSLKNAEKEFAAGCIVNACIEAKKWQPIRGQQFVYSMKANPMIASFVVEGVATALWSLVNDGFIEAVNYQGAIHFIPTPQLAKVFLADTTKLRIA